MNKKIVLISEVLFNQISDIANEYNEPLAEMAESLLNAQVAKYLAEKATIFYPGRKFAVDPNAFVQAMMLESDLDRFKKWDQFGAKIELWPCGKTELIIINHSLLEESKKQKQTA